MPMLLDHGHSSGVGRAEAVEPGPEKVEATKNPKKARPIRWRMVTNSLYDRFVSALAIQRKEFLEVLQCDLWHPLELSPVFSCCC